MPADDRTTDQDLWAAVVAAEQQAAAARAAFHRNAGSRRQVLAAGLRGHSAWERGAALSCLEAQPDDVPELLDQLVGLALLPGWAGRARRVIDRGRREAVLPAVRHIVDTLLPTAEADHYRRLAELLDHLADRPALHALVERAAASDDEETREVAVDFAS
ncbi:hypothetical protein [Streptomyces sp. NPDC021020]|uniref:hypothetical protein n=1 Tax=Streptomyces sp. NPDC021020 TaxID=3365109 RepID=UPI00378E7372